MALKLTDGDYVIGSDKSLTELSALSTLAQRVMLKLKIRRGAFIPLPNYGSRLHLVSGVKPSARQTAARQYVLEALSDEPQLTVEALEVSDGQDGTLILSLKLGCSGDYTLDLETEI